MNAHAAYVPSFAVRIDGEDLPSEVLSAVTSVSLESGRGAADRVEIDLANANLRWLQHHIKGLGFQPYPRGVRVGPIQVADAAEEGTFDLDNALELELGYSSASLTPMFEGEVTGVEVSFPTSGIPTLKLVAHDKLHRLAEGTKARGFGLLPDAVIAMILVGENLLIPMIDPTITAASTALAVVNAIFGGSGRKQGYPGQGATNLDMLKEIAASYDADFWAEGDVVYLSRFLKDYEPSVTLEWGRSLVDFHPKVSKVGQVAGVSMKFTLRELPLSFLVAVFWDFDRESLGFSIVPGLAGAVSFGGASIVRIDKAIASPADIAASALQIIHELRKKLNNRLTGTGTAVGDPRIRAGAIIRLEGLGPDFSGDYRVACASHAIDASGYRTSFQVFKEIIP